MSGEVEPKAGKSGAGAKRSKSEPKEGADGSGERRRTRLCSLQFVELAKTETGFHVIVSVPDERRSFSIPRAQAKQILDELDIASQIIRSQV